MRCGIEPYILIQPKAFAMELINIIPMQTGARYFIKKKYNFLRRNAEDCSTSLAMASRPVTRVIRKQVLVWSCLRHHNGIGQKVEKVQDGHSKERYEIQGAESEGRSGT